MNEGVRLALPEMFLEKAEHLAHRHEHHLSTVAFDGFDLGLGRGIGHEASRLCAEVATDPGEGLCRIAGADRAEAFGQGVGLERGHGIEHPANLERRDRLVDLGLEKNVGLMIEVVKRNARRVDHNFAQSIGGRTYFR